MRRSATCFETVEIKFPSTTQTKIYLPDIPILRNREILRVFSTYDFNTSKSPLNRSVVNTTVFGKTFLTLSMKGKEKINRFPIENLNPFASDYGPFWINDVIDFTKSFIEVGEPSSISASESVLLFFEYYDPQYAHQVYTDKLRCENIEVIVKDTGVQRFAFPDNENLRGMFIKYIFFNSTLSYTPSGFPTVNSTVRNYTFLSLVKGGVELINKVPLNLFATSLRNNVRLELGNIQVDQTQCYFWVPTTTGLVANEAFFINVFYFDPADQAPRNAAAPRQIRRT